MSLDKNAFEKAVQAFYANGEMLEFAIEAYLEELFKPGQLVVGEAIQPARDFRKELWIAEYASGGRDDANEALAEFDKTFPKDPS